MSKSSHIGINYLSSWKFQKFHIPLTVIQLTHTRIIHPSRIRLSYRLNRNPSRSNFIDRDVIIERKPNREKKNLHSSRSLRIVSWKTNASREAFESLSVDASRLTTSFANEPIWKFPRSKWSATLERAHARFVPDAPSIGSSLYHRSANISGKAKEPTSRPPFISTKLFDRER